jgi:hypothetical protein
VLGGRRRELIRQKEWNVSGIEQQVSAVLGDHASDYDIPGIVEEIHRLYGPVVSINEIHGPAWLGILDRNEAKLMRA